MLHIAARVACIAFLELGDCLGGSYGRLFRVRRISGFGQVICAKQAHQDETGCEWYLFHVRIYERTRSFRQFESQMPDRLKFITEWFPLLKKSEAFLAFFALLGR